MDTAGAKSPAQLRSLSTQELYEVQGKVFAHLMETGNWMVFHPIANGYFRTLPYDTLLENGALPDIPMMIGSTKDDINVRPEETAGGQRSRFARNCIGWALQTEKTGHHPSYVYYFTRKLPGDDAGAFHSSELWYMFGSLGSCWRPMTDADFALSERMVSYWTNFMKTGDPNGGGLPRWQSCTREHPCDMVLDI